MRRALGPILLVGALLGAPIGMSTTAARAQQPASAVPFRILDQDRLLHGSQFGQHILAGIHDAEQALQAENQRLFDQLAAEEQALTDQRPDLSPEEFRARADAFDAHVEEIRADRQRASEALTRQSEAQAQHFFDAALPVLVQLMNDERVIGLLKPDLLILGADWLDITDEAIARLDAAYAAGALSDGAAGPPDTNQTPDQTPVQTGSQTQTPSPTSIQSQSPAPSPVPSPEPSPQPAPQTGNP